MTFVRRKYLRNTCKPSERSCKEDPITIPLCRRTIVRRTILVADTIIATNRFMRRGGHLDKRYFTQREVSAASARQRVPAYLAKSSARSPLEFHLPIDQGLQFAGAIRRE